MRLRAWADLAATGEITTRDGARFIVGVDYEGDLYVHADKNAEPTFLMEYFDCTSASDGLDEVAKARRRGDPRHRLTRVPHPGPWHKIDL
ncbi:hypothetical protein [Streptomyces sp. NPDC091259]|uniref:hypothetical protein n=1 Tax=Streptomyces sp. NPDC091259 TaxID=3365976 RepID=UPI00381F46AD